MVVMDVGGVLVVVLEALVAVRMGVCADERRIVVVAMVLVVPMKVIVLKRLVRVTVGVAFADMEPDACGEEPGGDRCPCAAGTISEREGDGCADEGGEREY